MSSHVFDKEIQLVRAKNFLTVVVVQTKKHKQQQQKIQKKTYNKMKICDYYYI